MARLTFTADTVGLHTLFTEPVKQHSGRRPSVSKHPRKDIAVSVHDSTFSNNLYYSVGEVHKNRGVIDWSNPIQYGTYGKMPSVALVSFHGDLYTLEVHASEGLVNPSCCYNVGKVQRKEDQYVISWYDHTGACKAAGNMQACGQLCSGRKPKISANDDGDIIIVYEESFSKNSILYLGGKLQVNEGNVTIDWKVKDLHIPYFTGVEPDVAISKKRVALVSRSGFNDIRSLTGLITDGCALKVDSGVSKALPSGGINPSISINSDGYIVECHQSKTGRAIYHFCAHISEEWDISTLHTSHGEYPTVSLDDDGYILELHKTAFGTQLYQSQGEVKGMTLGQNDWVDPISEDNSNNAQQEKGTSDTPWSNESIEP